MMEKKEKESKSSRRLLSILQQRAIARYPAARDLSLEFRCVPRHPPQAASGAPGSRSRSAPLQSSPDPSAGLGRACQVTGERSKLPSSEVSSLQKRREAGGGDGGRAAAPKLLPFQSGGSVPVARRNGLTPAREVAKGAGESDE